MRKITPINPSIDPHSALGNPANQDRPGSTACESDMASGRSRGLRWLLIGMLLTGMYGYRTIRCRHSRWSQQRIYYPDNQWLLFMDSVQQRPNLADLHAVQRHGQRHHYLVCNG